MNASKRAAAMKRHTSALLHLETSVHDIKGIVFDCDGVLFDSKEANTAYYNHIRFAVELPPMTEEEAAYSHMASTEEVIERLIPEELLDEAKLVCSRTKYRDTFMEMMQPAPYMIHCLRDMRAAGLRLGLCTNRNDTIHEVLRHFGIEDFFSPVMTISQVAPKPAPDGLLEVAKLWGVRPDVLVFLGDSLVDQQAAAAAGVPFWSFANSELAATVHIANFKELGDIVNLMLMRE